MPDIGTWLGDHWDSAEHAVAEEFRWFGETAERHARPNDPYAQAPAAQPVTITAAAAAQPEGEPMSLSADLHAVADRVGKFDDETLARIEAIAGNPEARAVLADLAGLAQVSGLPSGVITGAATALKTVLSLYPEQAQQSAQPAA